MFLKMLKCKIHRATVTECDLNYEGSISIDADILKRAGLLPFEFVDIFNINNGERFATYVIEGEAGSGIFGLNGAAARKAVKGDQIIICAYSFLPEGEAPAYKPTIVLMDKGNRMQD